MVWYLARRVAGTACLLVVVIGVTFSLIHLIPGDAAQVLAGPAGGDPQYLAHLRHSLGLDRPLLDQMAVYLASVFRGNLGFSAIQGRPVLDVIISRSGATLLLAGTSLLLAAIGGVLLGIVAAARRHTRADTAISIGSLMASSLPVFWLGQILVGVFAVQLGWLPTGGLRSPGGSLGAGGLIDVIRHLVLPAGALSLLLLGLLVRITRSSMVNVLAEEHIGAARARGIPEWRLLLRHALPNAARPVVTVLTAELGLVLTGTVLVETVFSWPGLGTLLLDSVLNRDDPTLVGLLLVSSFAVAGANLLGDLVYLAIDPRVRLR